MSGAYDEDRWEPLARLVAGRLEPPLGLRPMLRPRLTWAQAGAPIDYIYRCSLRTRLSNTQVLAEILEYQAARHGPWRCELLVGIFATGTEHLRAHVAHGYAYPIMRTLGVQDERIGDETFDEHFVVKANDAALVSAWIDAPARQAMLAAGEFAYAVERNSVRVVGYGSADEPEPLAAALHAAVLLATRARRVETTWRQLAQELGGACRRDLDGTELSGRLVIEVPVGSEQVEARVMIGGLAGGMHRRGVQTRVSARRVLPVTDTFAVHRPRLPLGPLRQLRAVGDADGFDWRANDAEALAARMTDARRAEIAELAPAAVVGDPAAVSVWLDGIVEDAARLARAARLAQDFADEPPAPTQGPYR